MAFLESADSLKAKAHLSAVKTPVLIGVVVIALLVILLVIQGVWGVIRSDGFAVYQDSIESGSEKHAQQGSAATVDRGNDVSAVTYLYIHVAGAVMSPGVYKIEEGERVQAAIDAAGGFTEDASRNTVNLARKLVDGEQIIVMNRQEADSLQEDYASGISPAKGKININTATIVDLKALPGIGESTAKKIIADRESNGPFSSPEDIMRVSGIGEKKYADLADLICI